MTPTVDDRPLVAPDIDIVSPELFRNGPWEAYRRLREETPVAWDPRHQIWVVSRYADSSASRSTTSSSARARASGRSSRSTSRSSASTKPHHTQRRRLHQQGFATHGPQPRGRIRDDPQTLDRAAARGECDFMADLAVPIP
jgi:cytochrome P450